MACNTASMPLLAPILALLASAGRAGRRRCDAEEEEERHAAPYPHTTNARPQAATAHVTPPTHAPECCTRMASTSAAYCLF